MAAAALIALSSCNAMVPDDLQVVDVECFPDRQGVPLPGFYVPGGSASVFRVTVRTATNLSASIARKGFGVGVNVFSCDDPKFVLRSSMPYAQFDDASRDIRHNNGFHQYHFSFYSSEYFPYKNDTLGRKTYDLGRSPMNICFYFLGGNETGFGYRSNIGMIPIDTIQRLLSDHLNLQLSF